MNLNHMTYVRDNKQLNKSRYEAGEKIQNTTDDGTTANECFTWKYHQ